MTSTRASMGSKFGKIRLQASELTLSIRKISIELNWGKRCLHVFSDYLIRSFFVPTYNRNTAIHKCLIEFEFQPDSNPDYGVRCPWAFRKLMSPFLRIHFRNL